MIIRMINSHMVPMYIEASYIIPLYKLSQGTYGNWESRTFNLNYKQYE